MNKSTIVAIEALFATLSVETAEATKLAAINLCGELGDETGDVLNDLLERCYGPIDLTCYLWEASEEGVKYVCTAEDIKAFIDNRMDDGQFEAFASSEDVRVTQDSVDGWVYEFKLWLEQQD